MRENCEVVVKLQIVINKQHQEFLNQNTIIDGLKIRLNERRKV